MTIDNKYSLENLLSTFNSNALEVDASRLQQLKRFKENYPNNPLPKHLESDFNINRAFYNMIAEIMELKNGKE